MNLIVLKCIRAFFALLLLSFTLLCSLLALLQTNWGRGKLEKIAIQELKTHGITAKIEGLHGEIPFSWVIDHLELSFSEGEELLLRDLTLRLAVFPLFKKQLSIDYLNIEEATYQSGFRSIPGSVSIDGIKAILKEQIETLSPPCHLKIKTLKIANASISDPPVSFALNAKGTWKRNNKAFSCNIKLSPPNTSFVYAEFFLNGNKAKAVIDLGLKARIDSLQDLPILYPITSDGKLLIETLLSGPWNTWESLLWDSPSIAAPLEGSFRASLQDLKTSKYPLFNRNWFTRLHFRVQKDAPLHIEELKLLSDLISISLKADITQDLFYSKIILDFSLPNLSLASPLLDGKLDGKAYYNAMHMKCHLLTDALQVRDFKWESVEALLQTHLLNPAFSRIPLEGSLKFSADTGIIPFKGSFGFEWDAISHLNFSDILVQLYPTRSATWNLDRAKAPGIVDLKSPHIVNMGRLKIDDPREISRRSKSKFMTELGINTASLSGDLAVELQNPKPLFDGALSIHIDQINQLAPLFDDYHFNGSLCANCSLSKTGEQQNVELELLAKNLRYWDQFANATSLSLKLYNLYENPQGYCNLRAENIRSASLYLNQFDLQAASENSSKWMFDFHTQGLLQTPFHLSANGLWEKQGDLIELEMTHLDGEIVENRLHLQEPCTIQWDSSSVMGRKVVSTQACADGLLRWHLNLSKLLLQFPAKSEITPFKLSIGEGFLMSSFHFDELKSHAHIELLHLPLNLVKAFRPQLALNGSLTGSGFFNGDQNGLQGALNAVLEEAKISQYGRLEPLAAKGSIQTHFNDKIVQVQANLEATDQQFLELTASIPLEYQPYPFALKIDTTKPSSGELIAEGHIEELFDFINIGAHHMKGNTSAHLFLSQKLSNPALQGDITVENGFYENYITGMVLTNVHLQIQALKDHLELSSLSGQDQSVGTAFAQGKLELNAQKKFPYSFLAQLENFNILSFDLIDANFTGPLSITGDIDAALAHGSLTIPKATISILDELPYELPKLPVQFINPPSYLKSSQVSKFSVFPFNIDVELTSKNNIYVKGKGLFSEWDGDVHLTGTNMTVMGNGKLHLLKGEYTFSGRLFKLTEGEILFTDKPKPTSHIKLSGILNLPDVEITAQLQGPLTAPLLTFQSNPHLPTSSILSRILFNKDIDDISQPEAIQLANTLISLSGGAAPNILENIRKTLKVDRLSLVSAGKGSDALAIQIGKYLIKGVMITLSQSATSSQVIVEVELKKGFVFQAETQDVEEGKFSLKWRQSY